MRWNLFLCPSIMLHNHWAKLFLQALSWEVWVYFVWILKEFALKFFIYYYYYAFFFVTTSTYFRLYKPFEHRKIKKIQDKSASVQIFDIIQSFWNIPGFPGILAHSFLKDKTLKILESSQLFNSKLLSHTSTMKLHSNLKIFHILSTFLKCFDISDLIITFQNIQLCLKLHDNESQWESP